MIKLIIVSITALVISLCANFVLMNKYEQANKERESIANSVDSQIEMYQQDCHRIMSLQVMFAKMVTCYETISTMCRENEACVKFYEGICDTNER